MTLNYQLTSFDFLQYQLYQSSTSKLHIKKRRYNRIIVPVVVLLCGLFITYKTDDYYVMVIYGTIGVVWFICYPFYSAWRYKRYFEKHIKANYKDQVDIPVEIKITEDFIYTKDKLSEGKINVSEIKELVETKEYFFIKFTTNLALIVPKYVVEDQITFKKLIIRSEESYIDELNWKWK